MNTDRFIKIANKKQICEDYAIVGEDYLVLSDGCSSSQNTDIGARLLVHSAVKDIVHKNHHILNNYNAFGEIFLQGAAKSGVSLAEIDNSCLDATLLYAYFDYVAEAIQVFRVGVYGDGNVIVVYKNGNVAHIKIDFKNNAPYYPSHRYCPNDRELYEEVFCKPNPLVKNITTTDYYYPLSKESKTTLYHTVRHDTEDKYTFAKDDISYLILASDGIFSWINNKNELLTEYEVIRDLVDFKNHKGSFLQRRMQRICKEYDDLGYTNYDDISVVAMANFDETSYD